DKMNFQGQVQILGQEINTLKEGIIQHLARIQELETQLSIKTNQFNQELIETQQLQQSLADLQTQKQTSEDNLKDQLKAKVAELEQEKQTGRTSMVGLQKEIEDLKKQLMDKKITHNQTI